jgi:hypothetical protein
VEILGPRIVDIPGVTVPGGTFKSGNAFIQPGIASPAMVDLFDELLSRTATLPSWTTGLDRPPNRRIYSRPAYQVFANGIH